MSRTAPQQDDQENQGRGHENTPENSQRHSPAAHRASHVCHHPATEGHHPDHHEEWYHQENEHRDYGHFYRTIFDEHRYNAFLHPNRVTASGCAPTQQGALL